MTFKRTYERWLLKDGEGKVRIETSGGQGSCGAVAPNDDYDDDDQPRRPVSRSRYETGQSW